MTEFLSRSAVSSMQSLVDELVHQVTDTGMIVNGRKTKEMRIGPVLKDPPPFVSLSGAPVDRVSVQAAGSACCERPEVVASGTARTTDRAILQTECSPRDVVLALSAPV